MGEPGFWVAAAERGRKVLVHSSTSFEVGTMLYKNPISQLPCGYS